MTYVWKKPWQLHKYTTVLMHIKYGEQECNFVQSFRKGVNEVTLRDDTSDFNHIIKPKN